MPLRLRSWTNITGLLLSIACVIHCMLMPLCIASLPSWGLDWLVSPRVHQMLAVIGMAIGVATLVPGWREHRRSTVLLLAFVGLGIMNHAAFAGDNCCELPAGGASGEALPACCRESCCAKPESEEAATGETAFTTAGSLSAGLERPWHWLWAHPTAFGAALLACAHLLNGRCTRGCCRRGDDPVVTLESAT